MRKRLAKKIAVFLAVMIAVTCGVMIFASAAGNVTDGWIEGNLKVSIGSGQWFNSKITGCTKTNHPYNNNLRLEMWLAYDTSSGEETTWSNVYSADNTEEIEKSLSASTQWGRRGNAHHYGTCYHCGVYKYVETDVTM